MGKYSSIDDFLSNIEEDKKTQVQKIRSIVLEVSPDLKEHIKWNAPSYVLDGEDRITFNLINKQGLVKLVLHMGATRKEDKKGKPVLNDESGIVEWVSDIRGYVTFANTEDINLKESALKKFIKDWLEIRL